MKRDAAADSFPVRKGMSDEEADAYLNSQPLLLRYVFAFTRHALRWAVNSGWSKPPAAN